jgi:hypothetical protein
MAGVDFDSLMDLASTALARRDYLECEAQCLRALATAREKRDWAEYGRVLLPLQEARRQRRMLAAEGAVCLGSTHLPRDLTACLTPYPTACLAVTLPHGRREAQALTAVARGTRKFVEVLWADNRASAPRWRLHSLAGPEVACEVAGPPAGWADRWIAPSAGRPGAAAGPAAHPTPADWFLDAAEALGDQALSQAAAVHEPMARLAALEKCLEVVTDHELIHQRLWEAARALGAGSPR